MSFVKHAVTFQAATPDQQVDVHELKELEKGFLSKRNLRATGKHNSPKAIQTFLGASGAGPA